MITQIFVDHPLPWKTDGATIVDVNGHVVLVAYRQFTEKLGDIVNEINGACLLSETPSVPHQEMMLYLVPEGDGHYRICRFTGHERVDPRMVVPVQVSVATTHWEIVAKIVMEYWVRGVKPGGTSDGTEVGN